MNFQRRTLVALLLCALIWVVFDLLVPKPEPTPEELEAQQKAEQLEGKAEEGDATQAAADGEGEPEADGDVAVPSAPAPEVQELRVSTDVLGLTVTNRSPARGGLLQEIELLSDQFAEHETAKNALKLEGAPTLEVSFADKETDFRIPRATTFEVRESSDEHAVLAHRSDEVEITERVELVHGYQGRLVVSVTNRSQTPQQHRLHLSVREGLGGDSSRYDVQRGLCRTDEDLEEEDRSDVEDGAISYQGVIKWGGVDSKYFGTLLVPQQPFAACEIRQSEDARFLVTELTASAKTLEPGQTHEYVVGLFVGPKELDRLKAFDAVAVEPEGDLQEAIDWGIFGGLSEWLGRMLLALLRFFYGVVGAWGWAIVLLTIVIKLATLPLTLKQMASMRAMKRIQPELQKIKEKYADDRAKQAQESQALFARSGVNPLAGCLPLLVQMPIWFALYSMLGSVVELVHEPFLWLPDLTKQDPYYALPLALGAMMVLQNRMMPTTGDETQAKMMRWVMPIVFTGFMLFLPSGLGVYIFVNIVLSVIQTALQVGRNKDEPQTPPAKS